MVKKIKRNYTPGMENTTKAKTIIHRKANPKVLITVRLDPEVIAGFSAGGRGWMTRMNAVLVDWVRTHRPQTTVENTDPTKAKPGQ